MSILKSKKVKVVALALVVALMGGVISNTGVANKSKASEGTNQTVSTENKLADISYEELQELDQADIEDMVKDMTEEDIIEATEKLVIEAAKTIAKEQEPELELDAEVSAVVCDKATENVIGYEVSYSANEVPFGYVVIDANVENAVADIVIEENVPSLFNQTVAEYSAIAGTDKSAECKPVLYTTFTGKYAVATDNEFFFDCSVYTEDEFKTIVETNAQNPTEKGLGTLLAVGGGVALGSLITVGAAVLALPYISLYFWNNR